MLLISARAEIGRTVRDGEILIEYSNRWMIDPEDICDKLPVEINVGVVECRWNIVGISMEKYTEL